jgi:hypothetical protein
MDVEHELSAKRIERNVLEAELGGDELWDNEEYQRLQKRIAELEEMVAGDETDADAREANRLEPNEEATESGLEEDESTSIAFETRSH